MTSQNKGRPPLTERRRKRLHYSVWLTEEQKELIDRKIASSNLSASQYILTQLEVAPVKLPARKDIPDHIAKLIINLEKMSGILAFYAHRTKDRQLISDEWLHSSQLIRRLSELVSKWLFEQFEVSSMRDFFDKNRAAYFSLNELLELTRPTEEKKIILSRINQLAKLNDEMDNRYNRYYQSMDHDLTIFQTVASHPSDDVHTEIRNEIRNLLASL